VYTADHCLTTGSGCLASESAMCARSIDFPLYYCTKDSVLFYCGFIIDLVAILGFFIYVVFFNGIYSAALFSYVQHFHYAINVTYGVVIF
jgi:hypothetical protein